MSQIENREFQFLLMLVRGPNVYREILCVELRNSNWSKSIWNVTLRIKYDKLLLVMQPGHKRVTYPYHYSFIMKEENLEINKTPSLLG